MSPIISETNDCAHGIYDPQNGETIAQGVVGLPVFLANMQFAVQAVLAEANRTGGFQPGEVWILNDTYRGGTHLNDVKIVAPVFVDGELFALIASTGHWMDIGGGVARRLEPRRDRDPPGGHRDPAAAPVADGVRNEARRSRLIMANVRLPAGDARRPGGDELGGTDGRAAACATSWSATAATTLAECLSELIERSERQMRSPHRGHPGRDLPLRRHARQRRRRRRAAADRGGDHGLGRLDGDRLRGLVTGRRGPAEPRRGLDGLGLLRRAQAHLPRGADQRRHLPSGRDPVPGGHGGRGPLPRARAAAIWRSATACST